MLINLKRIAASMPTENIIKTTLESFMRARSTHTQQRTRLFVSNLQIINSESKLARAIHDLQDGRWKLALFPVPHVFPQRSAIPYSVIT